MTIIDWIFRYRNAVCKYNNKTYCVCTTVVYYLLCCVFFFYFLIYNNTIFWSFEKIMVPQVLKVLRKKIATNWFGSLARSPLVQFITKLLYWAPNHYRINSSKIKYA